MIDRDVLIKGLECCFNPHSDNSCFCKCSECPYDTDCHEWSPECQIQLNKDALAMLKEQPQIVRCKDCKKHYNELKCRCGGYTPADWFCADGERKEGR